jgi:hypothetical protein
MDKKENLCLEHITLTGANATGQELRLAERPYLSPPTSQSPNVRLLAQAGLELLKRLGQDPTKTTSIQLGEDIRLPQMPPDAGARADQDVELMGTSAERRKAKRLAAAKEKSEQSFEETPQELEKGSPAEPATGSTAGSDSKSVKTTAKSPKKKSSKIPKKQLAKQSSDKPKAGANDEAKAKSSVEKSKEPKQDRPEPEPTGEKNEKPAQVKSHVPKVKSSRAWKKKN